MCKGAVVARSTPRVEGTMLVDQDDAARSLMVGSPAWYAWLEDATTFAFVSGQGGFTAHKERSGQTGWYWKAYRRHKGRLHRAYLGKSADLTLDRLNAIAIELAGRATDLPPPRTAGAEPTSAVSQAFQLLTTKLYAPLARPQLVARPRLLALLDAGLQVKLTLLSAPAGFG